MEYSLGYLVTGEIDAYRISNIKYTCKSLSLNFLLSDWGDAIAESCIGGPFGSSGIIVETRC